MSVNNKNFPTKSDNSRSSIGFVVTVVLVVSIFLAGSQIIRKEHDSIEILDLKKQATGDSTIPQVAYEEKSPSQAESFYQSIKEGLKQPNLFPIQPRWSGEVYDTNMATDSESLEKLKQHVMVRHFFSCNARLTPEFRHLSELLKDWDIEQTPSILMRLFDSVRATELLRESMVENQELVNPRIQKELNEKLQKDKMYLGRMVNQLLGIKDPAFVNSLFSIRPKVGFGKPDTRIKPGEYLLIH